MHIRFVLLFSLVLAAAICLTGCVGADSDSDVDGAVKIYRASVERSELTWESYEPIRSEVNSLVEEFIAVLKSEPISEKNCKAVPDDVIIKEIFFGPDGQLVIDFDSNYLKMDTITEIICRAAIVKTITQLDEVEYVEFTIDGQPLMLRSETPIGQMTSETFIDNTGEGTKFRQSVHITVYFANESGRMLEDSRLHVESDGTKSIEELALLQLISGPLEIQANLEPVLSDKTVINKVTKKDGVVYVDFDSEFLNFNEGVSSEVAVYSVVNTLCDIAGNTKVSLTVDGVQAKMLDEMNAGQLFEQRSDLIATEKAGELD